MQNDTVEKLQRTKYRTDYVARMTQKTNTPNGYAAKMTELKLELIRSFYDHGRLLDLGCGSGDFLVRIAPYAERVIGVDFSPELIAEAKIRSASHHNISCIVGNVRRLPLRSESISLIFSYSSLYYVPRVEQAVRECSRVLERNGVAILEFGILHSLNTVVCKSYPDLAVPCHVTLVKARNLVEVAGFEVETDRAFQLLPFWGSKPVWLRPLLHRYWRRLFELDAGHRMLDEIVSGLWPLRHFSFRHIMVCRKL